MSDQLVSWTSDLRVVRVVSALSGRRSDHRSLPGDEDSRLLRHSEGSEMLRADGSGSPSACWDEMECRSLRCDCLCDL